MQNFANQSLNLLELSPSNKVFYLPDCSYGIFVGYRETEQESIILINLDNIYSSFPYSSIVKSLNRFSLLKRKIRNKKTRRESTLSSENLSWLDLTFRLRLLEVFILRVCKIGLPKICKNLAFELWSKSGVMRGFQKGITLGGRTSGSVWKV